MAARSIAPTSARAVGSMPRTSIDDTSRIATRTHPRYDQFYDDWTGLGHVYEGDGPYLDGSALIAHARELIYATDAEGRADFTTSIGEHRKFGQRKKLARYENFASVIVDTLVDHQFGKRPTRSISPRGVLGHHPLERFWEDVDGLSTPIDDWLEQAMTLAHIFGHTFVLMDRLERLERAMEGRMPKVRTRAQMSRPVLRLYTPLDAPDWLAPAGTLTAIKLREFKERDSLLSVSAAPQEEYLVFNAETWTRLAANGKPLGSGPHGFGRLPVLNLRARRRARIPVVGRPTLRDYRLYRDHFNMISELREIYRAQTFSMLNIELGDGETVEQARGKLGDHAGTDSIIFSSKRAAFIAPPEGPARLYAEDIHNLESKIFRLVGIPYEQDNRQGVSEGTARIKAMDLNRMLSHFASQAELLDYDIAGLWAAGQYGPGAAVRELDQDDLVIAHPDEFYTEQLAETVADATATIAVGVGPTATALIKQRVIHVALRDASREQIGQMEQEIEERAPYDAEQAELIADAARRSGRPAVADTGADGDGTEPKVKGSDPNNEPGSAGQSTDPRAAAPRAAAASRRDDPTPNAARRPTTMAELRRQHRRMR